MRATPLAVTALAAALLLTACDSGGSGSGSESDDSGSSRKPGDACQIGQLGVEAGPANAAPAAGDEGNIPVSLTNQSAPCTLEGIAGAVLKAGGASATVPAADGAQPEKLTLAKGDSVTFTLTYVRGGAAGAKSLAAKTLEISLPGAPDDVQSFPWSYGPVALKADGEAPDASVGPFTRAGD
ncbi:DUF4232 domain-containing protein [Streptomyces sp. ALI-76-A]|uniref:DUF4232 domain-containing protein n=1 Tax=Streptomyces sp. ALI-76-A TaxID=3025736 RepID=UPI00256EEDEF|nr:DUF4232 domain-containing protein [Streptomyces sp. ALI-76-A]MDL5202947.1 DUF4232 domain-containing protein [Streptomyces sp. ALI-76-A]